MNKYETGQQNKKLKETPDPFFKSTNDMKTRKGKRYSSIAPIMRPEKKKKK